MKDLKITNKSKTRIHFERYRNNKPEIKMFLNFIKEFSILHFETSEII